jgi:hypothetical protein
MQNMMKNFAKIFPQKKLYIYIYVYVYLCIYIYIYIGIYGYKSII